MPVVTADQIRFANELTEHNGKLIAGIEKSLATYKALPKDKKTVFVRGQIAYWQNAIAALKWSTRVARQKAKLNE